MRHQLTSTIAAVGLTILLAAQDQHPKKGQSSEEHYACKLDSGFRKCHCPAMVAEVQDEYIKGCLKSPGTYSECMKHMPGPCVIVQTADERTPQSEHAEHTCQRTCSTKSICRCHDGPMCEGPVVAKSAGGSDDSGEDLH